jgi:hypothetical protein
MHRGDTHPTYQRRLSALFPREIHQRQNLVRTQGDDTIHEGDGKDTMSCGQGDDRLYGGDDNDYFLVMRAMIYERQATALMR